MESKRGARPRIVVGNWKMNPSTTAEAVALAAAVVTAQDGSTGVEVGVAPPAIALEQVARAVKGSRVSVYAQDLHWAEQGAYTGQLPASMLSGIASGVIVGHSEVRRDQGDDDTRVSAKTKRALAAGLRAVVCVGESEAQFVAGETARVVVRQVAAAVADLASGALIVIAYEPIWAIGTGRPATAEHASAAAAAIRTALESAGADAESIPVLYGGSVTAASAPEFAGAAGIDGALVGGASLKAEEFRAIVNAFR